MYLTDCKIGFWTGKLSFKAAPSILQSLLWLWLSIGGKCHQDEWVSGWVSKWVSVTIESRSWPNFKPMFPGPTCCCFWSILVPYFLGYKAYSVIRRTLNFWTCFFQVDKLKISPKYPVLRCNLNFGLFHYLHFQSNSVFKVPNYSHVTFFKQKSHICSNKVNFEPCSL